MKKLLDWVKAVDVCSVLNGHSNLRGMCPTCGLHVGESPVPGDKVWHYYASIFYRSVKGDKFNFFENAIDESGRDFQLKEFIEAGKYLIDNVYPNRTSGSNKLSVLASAAALGYIKDGMPEAMLNKISSLVPNSFIASRSTFKIVGLNKALGAKKYDKEQIDEMFDSNPGSWLRIRTSYGRPYSFKITDRKYFLKKMDELYEVKRFEDLSVICNIFMFPKVFTNIDSKYFPFLSSQMICMATKSNKRLLRLFKKDILNNIKYIHKGMVNPVLGDLVWELSRLDELNGPRPKTIKLNF